MKTETKKINKIIKEIKIENDEIVPRFNTKSFFKSLIICFIIGLIIFTIILYNIYY